jgi:DNA-binding NarL/FixJ family response regulator
MTTVAIADDQDLVRSGLRLLLETRGLVVVGEAANGREAVEMVRRTTPDVILMDIRMPVLDGGSVSETPAPMGTADTTGSGKASAATVGQASADSAALF